MKNTTKAHIAVLSTNLFFAANYSLVKAISPLLIKPFALNVYRVGGSLLLFWMVWLLSKTSAKIKREDIGRFILCGLTGVAINQTLFIKGLTLTSTIHASLLILTTPLLITVFALWVLKERLTNRKITGLILGICGSILLVLAKESGAHATNYLLGDMLIFINAISYAVYFILVKPLMQKYSPLHVVRWIFTIGFFMLLPFGWVESGEIKWDAFEITDFIFLIAIVFTGTFLAYFFTAYGIQNLGAGTTGSYIYTQPLFAVLIATLFLSEAFTGQKIIAAILIFLGVYLVSFKAKQSTV